MQKLKSFVKSPKLKSAAKAVTAVVLSAGAMAAQAAVDISADTTSAKTDIATAGGLIVGVVVAVAAIAWIRKVVH